MASNEISDFVIADTMNEVLLIAIEQLEEVRQSTSSLGQIVHLKMASMALQCAMKILGSQINPAKEEEKNDQISRHYVS
jgi:hypothetical protein